MHGKTSFKQLQFKELNTWLARQLPVRAFFHRTALAILFLTIIAISNATAAFCAGKELWENFVIEGNEYRERDRQGDARRLYQRALKILEKENVTDLRKAIVLHDIAECYRAETKWHPAQLAAIESHGIYSREIAKKQLGYEYGEKKPIKLESGSLKPACYLCHENYKVVPILYGKDTGYSGEPPPESDWAFTHKPGGPTYMDQRWYCRECHQSF